MNGTKMYQKMFFPPVALAFALAFALSTATNAQADIDIVTKLRLLSAQNDVFDEDVKLEGLHQEQTYLEQAMFNLYGASLTTSNSPVDTNDLQKTLKLVKEQLALLDKAVDDESALLNQAISRLPAGVKPDTPYYKKYEARRIQEFRDLMSSNN